MIELSVAIGDYDRNRPLFDGRVKIDGAKPVMMALSPEEMFFRAMRHEAFDVCELSLSSHTLRTSRGDAPYVAIPAFVSRAFRHTGIIVRADSGIAEPAQLKGRRVGLPEWQLTANVWIRALLEDEYGVRPQDIRWVRGGLEEPGRVEKVKLDLPDGVEIEEIGPNDTLKDMLADGRIDAFIGPRAPTTFVPGNPDLRWLFADPTAEAERYFRKTRIFPIMHVIGIRKSLAEKHPWLPVAVYKAFVQSKALTLEQLSETSATKVTLPFVEEQLRRARSLMGDDYWPYGIEKSRHVLEYFLDAHYRQGLSERKVKVEDLFHASAMETYVI